MHSTAPGIVVQRAEWRKRGGMKTLRSLPATTGMPSFDNRENRDHEEGDRRRTVLVLPTLPEGATVAYAL